jgi:hypothetical protein
MGREAEDVDFAGVCIRTVPYVRACVCAPDVRACVCVCVCVCVCANAFLSSLGHDTGFSTSEGLNKAKVHQD